MIDDQDSIAELQAENARLKAWLHGGDSVSIAGVEILVLRVGKTRVVEYANGAFCRHFKTTKEDLLGRPAGTLLKLGAPEMAAAILNALAKLREDGQDSSSFTEQDGRRFDMLLHRRGGVCDITLRDTSEMDKLRGFVRRYVTADLDSLSPEDRATFDIPERRFMSVSFTDLRGFTAMCEKLPPEEVRSVINTYLEEAIQAIDANQATVDKIVGDEVMALYGAPRHYKDHALRAVTTAWDQLTRVQEAQQLFRGMGKTIPSCGIGINTGDMVLGDIGGGSRHDYTVLGAAVNLGARLCSAAAPDQILCSCFTLDAVLADLPAGWGRLEMEEDCEEPQKNGEIVRARRRVVRIGPGVEADPRKALFRFVALEPVQAKGIAEPVPVYAVHGGRKQQAVQLRPETVSRDSVLRIFGRYRLLSEIGRGGMGVVYVAKDGFGNRLAIKTMLAGQGASEAQILRFAREAEIMAKLSHRHICRIHEVGEFEGTRYIAMELVEGHTLDHRFRGVDPRGHTVTQADAASPHSATVAVSQAVLAARRKGKDRPGDRINETLTLFLKILEGLGYAHQHGVIHRDLKPANVMVRPDGEPVLMDFGLARFEDHHEAQVSLSSQMVGTIGYVAPEQAVGDRKADRRSDIYSAAAILYRLLTDERHFSPTDNILSDIAALKDYRPVPPSRHNRHISEDLEVVLLKALHPDPDQRYADVELFAGDIRACLEGGPISARRENALQRAARWSRKHKALAGTVAASVVLLIGMFIFHYAQVTSALRKFEAADRLAREKTEMARLEREKAEATLSELKQELAKGSKAYNWQKLKDFAYRILVYDKAYGPALEVVETADSELLRQEFPLVRHPPSGVPSRIAHAERALAAWRALAATGNRPAVEMVAGFQAMLREERQAAAGLVSRYPGLGLEQDAWGYRFTEPVTGLAFRYIPPGRFDMGDEVESTPVHPVELTRGFFLSATEVTQSCWRKVAGDNPSEFQGNDANPVDSVTWKEALLFCDVLNEAAGLPTLGGNAEPSRVHYALFMNRPGFRLPTEAEWEYACRADVPNRHHFWWQADEGQEGDISPMWYADTSGSSVENRRSQPTAQHPPNPWGLFDMHGNVFEWVLDTYDPFFYQIAKPANPFCARMDGPGILRGGSFRNSRFSCRSGFRQAFDADKKNSGIGFRLCFRPKT